MLFSINSINYPTVSMNKTKLKKFKSQLLKDKEAVLQSITNLQTSSAQ